MTRFSDWMIAENLQVFWAAMARGDFITDAAEQAGTYRKKGARWLVAAGGVRPRRGRDLKGRCLSFTEREEIALGRAAGESLRSIAARLGRSPSTISRELARNQDPNRGYRATTAHALAYDRASRPKPAKPHSNTVLRGRVEQDLEKKYSLEPHIDRRDQPPQAPRPGRRRRHLRGQARRRVPHVEPVRGRRDRTGPARLVRLPGSELDLAVGGLGLGYTAQAVLVDQRVRELVVIDALEPVVQWHQRGLVPIGPILTADPRRRGLRNTNSHSRTGSRT